MKKLLAILLAVTMLVTVSAFGLGAVSYGFCNHTVESGGGCSGDCVINNTPLPNGRFYIYGEATTWHAYLSGVAEIYSAHFGIWYPSPYIGTSVTNTTDAYETATQDYTNKFDFECSHYIYPGR